MKEKNEKREALFLPYQYFWATKQVCLKELI